MLNQIISSVFVGAALIVAAVMLGSPGAVLAIAFSGALAWLGHLSEEYGYRLFGHVWQLLGLILSILVFIHLCLAL